MRPAHRSRWLLLAACLAFAVADGVLPGQDANWDLRNYHYYAPYALVHGRHAVDLAPAQRQTWLNPLWDLVSYYAPVRAGADSRLVTALLSLPAGLALFCLLLLTRRAAPELGPLATAAVVLLAATGAGSGPNVGTTMSEWHNTALLLLAAWLVLTAGARPGGAPRLVALAGVCGGCAVGLKLTAAPFALGLAAMALCQPGDLRRRATSLLALGAGGALGFALTYGWWAGYLLHHYGNPFFPFFNDLFRSPLAAPLPFTDPRFLTTGLVPLLTLPFRLCATTVRVVGELPVRDPRLAAGAIAAAVLALLAWRRGAAARAPLALAAFFAVSYVAWATLFGALRFAGPLEVWSALLVAMALRELAAAAPGPAAPRARRWAGAVATAAVAGALAAWTVWPVWGRVPHGAPAVQVQPGDVPPDAMVVIASGAPMAYVVPSLPPRVPVVAVADNLFEGPPGTGGELQRTARARVRGHAGPLLLLTARGFFDPRNASAAFTAAALDWVGCTPDLRACAPIPSALDGDALVLCPLQRR